MSDFAQDDFPIVESTIGLSNDDYGSVIVASGMYAGMLSVGTACILSIGFSVIIKIFKKN